MIIDRDILKMGFLHSDSTGEVEEYESKENINISEAEHCPRYRLTNEPNLLAWSNKITVKELFRQEFGNYKYITIFSETYSSPVFLRRALQALKLIS